jgi:hypothetical protein
MGHAGAWTSIGEGTSESKYKALESAGVTMVDHPAKFGSVMKEILAKSGRSVDRIVSCTSFPSKITKLTETYAGAVRIQGPTNPVLPYNLTEHTPSTSNIKLSNYDTKARSSP